MRALGLGTEAEARQIFAQGEEAVVASERHETDGAEPDHQSDRDRMARPREQLDHAGDGAEVYAVAMHLREYRPAAAERRERQRALLELGWFVVPWTWDDIQQNPEALIEGLKVTLFKAQAWVAGELAQQASMQ